MNKEKNQKEEVANTTSKAEEDNESPEDMQICGEISNADDMMFNVIFQEQQNLLKIARRVESLLPFIRDIKIHIELYKSKYEHEWRDVLYSENLSVDLERCISKAKWVDRELFLIFDQLYNLHLEVIEEEN